MAYLTDILKIITMVQLAISGGEVHVPLARCRVLYLGSAVPSETAVGLDAIQQPLRERYKGKSDGKMEGIDAFLTVYNSGIQLQYVGDYASVTWFPIQLLQVCAAVKCVTMVNNATGDSHSTFVALNSAAASASKHPPMFASIMRNKLRDGVACHIFVCKSNRAALGLVQSSTHAYERKEGWNDGMLDKPQLVPADPVNIENAPPRAPGSPLVRMVPSGHPVNTEIAPTELDQQPQDQGYVFASGKHLAKNYNVFVGRHGPPPARMVLPLPIPPRLASPLRLLSPRPPPPGHPGMRPQPGTLIRSPPPSTLIQTTPMIPGPPPPGGHVQQGKGKRQN